MPNFTIEIQIPAMEHLAEALMGAAKNIPGGASNTLAPMPEVKNSVAPAVLQQSAPAYVSTVPQQQPYPPVMPVNPAPAPQPVATAAPVSTAPIAPAPVPNAAPVASAPTFAQDDLARASSQLMDTGKQQQLIALLGQFGVQALTQLPKERYGEFATALRQLGAKI